MATYITIRRDGTEDYDTYPVDTEDQCAAAQAAMRDAGMDCCVVYAGEPDGLGDSYATERRLFA